MQKIILSTLLVVVMGCYSQKSNEITLDNGSTFLVGKILIEDLQRESYGTWFSQNQEAYEVDSNRIVPHAKAINEHKILIFMGTWCGDSKREVPRMLKILDAIDFPREQLKIVAVDRRKESYKKSPNGEEWGLDIRRVPTFIFLKAGREVGRIVESPVESLEADMIAITTGKAYVSKYSSADK